MNELKYEVKIAILKILNELLLADSVVHEKELEYFNEVATNLGITEEQKVDVGKCLTLHALSLIREQSAEVKMEVAKYMGRMVVVDENINYNEVKFYNIVCDACLIGEEFDMDAYPDITVSGPVDSLDELN